MTVMLMGQMSLDDWDEKSKKNDEDKVVGMRQEFYSTKGKEMHNEMSDLLVLNREMRMVEVETEKQKMNNEFQHKAT